MQTTIKPQQCERELHSHGWLITHHLITVCFVTK